MADASMVLTVDSWYDNNVRGECSIALTAEEVKRVMEASEMFYVRCRTCSAYGIARYTWHRPS